VVGLRLPEDEDATVPLTRWQAFRRKLADIWSSVAGV
jgi:cell volume regulation protein A